MKRKILILMRNRLKLSYRAFNGEILSVLRRKNGDELLVNDVGEKGRKQCLIEADGDEGFTFLPCAVRAASPVFLPKAGVVVTDDVGEKDYGEVERRILSVKRSTERERLENSAEKTLREAGRLRWNRCPTFLAVPGNVNLWEAGFRGFPIEERQHFDLYDYFIPRKNWDRVSFGKDAERVVYRYSMGRGMGAASDPERRNYKGIYPCLTAGLTDGGVRYSLTAFCDAKTERISDDGGTDWRNALYHSASNSLDESEKRVASGLESDDTVLRVRLVAQNVSASSAIAYFRLPQINTPVMAESDRIDEKIEKGFGYYGDSVYMRATVCGEGAEGAEVSFILAPGEKAEIHALLFHVPVTRAYAEGFDENDFEKRLRSAEKYWRDMLGDLADWRLPEKAIDEAVKTGYFHLKESCFGQKGGDVFAPSVGVYPPIGSESSPVIRFLDSCGDGEFAGKCMNFFFDREKENGFIQNIAGYMLENGATLYNERLHYAYTRDIGQVARNFPAIRKATEYLLRWIDANRDEKPFGYGMIDGQVADPEDTFRSYALNALAYAGLRGAAELYEAYGEDPSAVRRYADELKENIRAAFRVAMRRSPLVPLKDGRWVPSVAPGAEGRGACSMHFDGESCFTHASSVLKDSLLSLPFLVWYGVFDVGSEEAELIADLSADLYSYDNTAFSQPYYNLVPLVNLARGEKKAFLSEYYTAFATLADRETYSFWEHYFLATPHKTHEQAWFLMRTRYMLYLEKEEEIVFLSGVPEGWTGKGKRIYLKNARCLFGGFTLEAVYTENACEVSVESDFDRPCTLYGKGGKKISARLKKGKNIFVIG